MLTKVDISKTNFKVGPEVVQGGPDLVQGGSLPVQGGSLPVQGGPLLVQPRVSSTVYIYLYSSEQSLTLKSLRSCS